MANEPKDPNEPLPKAHVRPLILVRGFGGPDVGDEQRDAYQGFNNGTVYALRQGENYIYEGFVLRALKSGRYRDATNVVGYHNRDIKPLTAAGDSPDDPTRLRWAADLLSGTVAVDEAAAARVLQGQGVSGTLWVYRFYDLQPRTINRYGEGLARLIRIIRAGAELTDQVFSGVDVIAHSMGGLVVRAALRQLKEAGDRPEELVHRIVTLGTPHRGIAFQYLPEWLLRAVPQVSAAADEMASFDPGGTDFLNVPKWFPLDRILTVVGTNYRSYGTQAASWANRLSNLADSDPLAANRSDGLVKQSSAQLPGAPRTFVDKCHGGSDSLVTSREAYEIAMRFLHGTHRVVLWLDRAKVKRGADFFGKSEFWLGVGIKPRGVDFELFHQGREAENCYGPFDIDHDTGELVDGPPPLEQELQKPLNAPGDRTTGWPRVEPPNRRLVWEGWLDRSVRPTGTADDGTMVLRLDIQVGERDRAGIGFSDNVVFRKQYYVQWLPAQGGDAESVFVHTGEEYLSQNAAAALAPHLGNESTSAVQQAHPADGGQEFRIGGTGFEATLRIAMIPEDSRGNADV
ncbi:hypothetical protein ADL01_39800 [Streptomyces sp. NRRL WC-3618]|uniref:lipase family alpha/beta hydrolase n=1 Tax=Streptomyces sp. NRRL WC-3618 TaxID=1519490 RepID=UPI0006AD8BAC|nr:alpha/beta hydrolase [Streptomyces sp. NRRL WC-3618]KOV57688.1 hypothetical protein ADL01_39800 [Streptomyces sp. NRRL WC-3618]